jgi:hypothetical protein
MRSILDNKLDRNPPVAGLPTPFRSSIPTSVDPATTINPLRRWTLLTHPVLDQLAKLGLSGMAPAFTELEASGEGASLTWLVRMVERRP